MMFLMEGVEMVERPFFPSDDESSGEVITEVATKSLENNCRAMSDPEIIKKKMIEDFPAGSYDPIFSFCEDEETLPVRRRSEREEVNFLEDFLEELEGPAAIEIETIKTLLEKGTSYSLIEEKWECFKKIFLDKLHGRAFEGFDEFISDYREGRKSLEIGSK